MNIAETGHKSKAFLARIPRDILILTVLVLACTFSFGFGYRAGLDATAAGETWAPSVTLTSTSTEGAVVASKSGMKYYLPSCAGVNRISDANKVWFPSAIAANAAGYTPASNCDGL